MPATIIMGGQWGDEGKGKLTDALAGEAHVVVRANGGNNAGHTVATPLGTFKLHLVPSGILSPDCTCIVGAGVVIDPIALLAEMDDLVARGVSIDNLRISDRAHVVLPYHPLLDTLQEERREEEEIGTTRRGNGPAYADKVARHGIRMVDLVDEVALRRRLLTEIDEKNQILAGVYGHPGLDFEAVYRDLVEAGRRLERHLVSSEVLVQDALAAGKEVLVECAQGPMLDIDYGTYPFVTSSSPTAAGACQGAGVAPTQVRRVIAVFKAYSTRVGGGPFPTELHDEIGNTIRERGQEYGTSTGRPRRTGWFDAVAGRHVARLNGVTEIALTLLDVLDAFEEINVCTSYRLHGEVLTHLPARHDAFALIEPIYSRLSGWRADTTAARTATDIPRAALDYIQFIEGHLGAPITMLGIGPNRDQLVPLSPNAAIGSAQPEPVG